MIYGPLNKNKDYNQCGSDSAVCAHTHEPFHCFTGITLIFWSPPLIQSLLSILTKIEWYCNIPFVPKRDSKQIYMPATVVIPLYFFKVFKLSLAHWAGMKGYFQINMNNENWNWSIFPENFNLIWASCLSCLQTVSSNVV